MAVHIPRSSDVTKPATFKAKVRSAIVKVPYTSIHPENPAQRLTGPKSEKSDTAKQKRNNSKNNLRTAILEDNVQSNVDMKLVDATFISDLYTQDLDTGIPTGFICKAINIEKSSGSLAQFAGHTSDGEKEREQHKRALHILSLFLFAIMFKKEKLANIMWEMCKDRIGAALIASALLKKLSKKAKQVAELNLCLEMLSLANEYEGKACNMLKVCYKHNRENAHRLLFRPLVEPFDSTTMLDLAEANHLKTFMGQTCCQTKLQEIWRGNIAAITPWYKIVVSLFLPFCLQLITFREGNQNNKVRFFRNCTSDNKSKQPQTGEGKDVVPLSKALWYLYSAPLSVFILNTFFYLWFLVLFSYFVLVDLDEQITYTEWAVWGWILIFLYDECRQIANSGKTCDFPKTFCNWIISPWNKFDLFMFGTIIVTLALRFSLVGIDFDYVRYAYSFSVGMFYLRFLQNFFVHENIGPKVLMIGKMMIDLFQFLGIGLVFVLCFGIIYQANLYPNSPAAEKLLEKIFFVPYWQIFGELFLDELTGYPEGYCTSNETIWRADGGNGRCPEIRRLVPIIGGVYIFLTNIVLVNLLIAMFSHTFDAIQKKSERIWRFYFYRLINEYRNKPVLFHHWSL